MRTLFRCFIIGEGSLPIQCIDVLLAREHRILGVISKDSDVLLKAQEQQLPIYDPIHDNKADFASKLITFLQKQPFDYLFSIVNLSVLPNEILKLPAKYAINYHDAPLPKYAGMYATSWALMNREVKHGISWHVMTEEIDAGDILKQPLIDIAPHDTAFTLNAKCYEAALTAFDELINELAHDQITPVPQNLAERSYYSLSQRPPAGGVISWQQGAEEIDALSRALTFGAYPNELSLPKVALGEDFFIVGELELGCGMPTAAPGTIISIDVDGAAGTTLTVATRSRPLIIKTLLTIDGVPLSLSDLVKQYDLHVGKPFRDLSPAIANAITVQNRKIARHETFWHRRLATLQPMEPPYRKPVVNPPSNQVAALVVSIPDEVIGFLQACHWNPQHFLFTLFAVYLSRLNDIDYFDVASTLAPPIRGVGGFFASQIPLRVAIEAEWPFERVYKALERERALCARRQTYARDMVARSPELRAKPELQQLHPISVTMTQTAEAWSLKADGLTLYLAEQEVGSHSATIVYPRDLFDQALIGGMVGHLQTLMEAVAATPEQPIKTLPLLSAAERHQLLVEWNDTRTDYPTDKCIHQLFEEQVERTPHAIAVVFEDQHLTCTELNTRANQLAHHLRSLGVGPDVRVGICVERSLEMVVGLLGILKAGGAYVPLDSAYPQERLAFMLQDASVSVLLTQEHLRESLPFTTAQIIYLDFDSDWRQIVLQSNENLDGQILPDNLAYVIYTSGSTGKPKGVMIPHQALSNHMLWMQKAFNFSINDKILQKTPISFDASIWEVFAPLISGGIMVLAQPGGHQDPVYLARAIEIYKITVVQFVPALFQMLLETKAFEQCIEIRRIFCGGEPLRLDLCQRFRDLNSAATLYNLYGPTEACIDTTFWSLQGDTDMIPIGSPIDNVQVYILDQNLQLCPVGVPGELHIGGIGQARGYLNRPELTAEKFIINSFGPQITPGKLYKTGDLTRWLPDGNIEFLGRIDHQVKIRGFRIELGEIESALHQHPAVRETVVIARDDQAHQDLVAYMVPKEPASGAELIPALRTHLKRRLPGYMVPSAFVLLDHLPLTPSGKVDRKALTAPARGGGESSYTPPITPSEEMLANIWAEVLGLGRVGREDHFFELGGHSLLAIQVISRLREAFDVELPVRVVFESPSIAELARTIETARQTEHPLPVPPPILPVARETETYPLSFAQQRLWFLDQLEGTIATYNIATAFRLTLSDHQNTPLQVDALEAALNQLIERHEVLRTTFPTTDGQPIQQIHSELRPPLTVLDLQALGASEQAAELDRLLTQEAQQPFDLAQGPLLRVYVYVLSEIEQVLQLTIHHIISDAWSMDILTNELSTLYQAALTDQSCGLPDLPVQYADFAQWQRNWLQGEVLETQLTYWQAQLVHAPTLLNLPTDHPRPLMQTFNGQLERFELEAELTGQLRDLSRRMGTSSFMTYYAAFAVLMLRYSDQEDLVIGTPIANRHSREIEPLIGFFLNTLALRTDLSGAPSFSDLLKQVRQVTLDAYAHQDIPFEQLVEELAVERNLSHAPLLQVMLAWLEQSPPAMLGAMKMVPLPLPTVTAKFDLTLYVGHTEKTGDGLWGAIEYNSDLFEQATIQRMIGHFKQLLAGIVADPAQPVNALPMLTPVERQQLLVEWNHYQTAYPTDKSINQLFEEQAARTPDALAVVYGEAQFNYRDLNQRANQLAHYLIQSGVVPDVLVGICVERSLDMVVGLLGILKAGGAYLPLDPDYPAQRLVFMLEDAHVPLVLTQQSLVDRFSEPAIPLLCLDADWPTLAAESAENPPNQLGPESLAYVIYTSGSTGRPKGVMVPHRGINRLVNHTNYIDITSQDRMAQASNASFDAATFEIWGALLHGACLVGIGREVALSPQRLAEALHQQAISILFLTTALFNQVVSFAPGAFRGLRYLLFGGEAVDPAAVRQLLEDGAPEHFVHVYGPTENTTYSTWYAIDRVGDNAMTVPIGLPIANTGVYVLDGELEPVPVGVPGELYLGGDGLALGYLNRSKLTSETFIANPFGSGTLYKTGDLVRYLPDGNIEFIGRMDHQVKLRGFRIELGEIESVLGKHPDVLETVVVARDDHEHKALVAYAVPKEQTSAVELISVLRTYLKQMLPEYMVPSAFVLLDHLPLTPNGKIDRQALPDPERGIDESSYTPPITPTEKALAAIWAGVLGIERVGLQDNFFELGGHSLLATQAISRARDAFQLDLSVRALFECSTLMALAERIEDDQLVLALQGLSTSMSSETAQESGDDEMIL